ncbi:MAG TPA: hypothetical protein ENJ31_13385, partial [Anaerolineae bacterium]|nr:hypothetical protein [Anaerolineae bacterium]
AEAFLEKLSQKAPSVAAGILDKIEWLAENAEAIKHERLQGRREFSLHCGQYRLPYLLDRRKGLIVIVAAGKHDEAYRRLRE